MDDLFYNTLRENGVLFGCHVLTRELQTNLMQFKRLSVQDQATFVNVDTLFTALIRALIGLVPAILLTSPLFGISLLDLGLPLAFIFLSLYIFGITLGIFVASGLLRFGPSFENIAWSTMFLLAPFGCIYYPVETLPEIFQSIAYLLPLVYIFEETRNILVNQLVNYENIIQALYLNAIYLFISISVFYYSFDKARDKGTLINIGE